MATVGLLEDPPLVWAMKEQYKKVSGMTAVPPVTGPQEAVADAVTVLLLVPITGANS